MANTSGQETAPQPVLVTGAEGQLGRDLLTRLGPRGIGLAHRELDICDADAVRRTVREVRPQVIVNAAAYTQVDRAEEEPDLCRAVNVSAVGTLAEAANDCGATLVQISTDYVFGEAAAPADRRPHDESGPVCPRGIYALSKWEGERCADSADEHLIVRTCGLYTPGGRNFVETMLRLGASRDLIRVVDDQWCNPTYVPHLGRALVYLIDRRARGLLHVVNTEATTWHRFARQIFALAGQSVDVEPISSAEYGAAAPRPAYSALDTTRYHALGGPPMPHWAAALAEMLTARGFSNGTR